MISWSIRIRREHPTAVSSQKLVQSEKTHTFAERQEQPVSANILMSDVKGPSHISTC